MHPLRLEFGQDMVATISGIKYALDQIRKSENESRSRIRIVHVDYTWDYRNALVSDVLNFFSDEDKSLIDTRNATSPESGRLVPDHGTACAAILKTVGQLNQYEEQVWNLAPLSELFALPLAEPAKKFPFGGLGQLLEVIRGNQEFDDPKVSEDWDSFFDEWDDGFQSANYRDSLDKNVKLSSKILDFIDYQNSKTALIETFDRLIGLCESRRLIPGDIIVCTMCITSQECCPSKAIARNFDFPLIQLRCIRERIEKITGFYGVSVVTSAGNSGLDFSHAPSLPLFFGTKIDQEIYKNRGVSCGAVLVGADTKHSNRSENREVNTGKCIDTSGRYKLTNTGKFSPALEALSDHWSLSSGASMVAAACIANIQHYRQLNGFPILKPYETRAHLRQWAAMMPAKSIGMVNNDGFMGSPPDLKAWMEGTGVV